MRLAEIQTKKLRKIRHHVIPVLSGGKQTDSIVLKEMNGVILVPVSRAYEIIGVPTSTVRNWINEGTLRVYNANGSPKTDNSSRRTFFNLTEFLSQ